MGYPMRWEQVCVPAVEEDRLGEDCRETEALRRYFKRIVALTLAGSALLVLAVMAATNLWLGSSAAAALQYQPSVVCSSLSVSPPSGSRSLGYVTVRGSVANRTNAALARVAAVVDLLDSQGRTVRSESAALTDDPVAPGARTEYVVELPDDSRASAFRVHFKRLFGPELN